MRTTTENLAELVAFARALQWARLYAMARGRSICIRYHSEYAARIATGAWKARKHKAMAEEAQQAWTALKRANGGRVWMRHVPSTDGRHRAGANLAVRGKAGESIYAEDVE